MLEYDKILTSLENPNENGILLFVLGFLFMLSVYHLLLYFQHRDKVYAYYTLYTGLIFINYLNLVPQGFLRLVIQPIIPFLDTFEVFFKWLYNCVYFVFAFTFVDTKAFSKTWYKIILYPIYVLLGIGIVLQSTSLITGNDSYIHEGFFLFFVPFIFIPTFIGYYILFKMKSVVRYYIIIGSLFLFITSILGALIYYLEWLPKENRLRDSIFYFGLIVENICFSLGLGHKQRLIFEERNKQKEELIKTAIINQEEERNRIGREIHDGAVQKIGSIILKSKSLLNKLNLLEEKEAQELLKELENSSKDLRTISHQMMPRALQELGIIPALKDLLYESLHYADIKYHFDYFNVENKILKKTETIIYRVSQELINNIIKHSKATEVSFQLYKNDKNIILIVEDNGIGISKKNIKKGIGLLNISSRLNLVNGEVHFEPSPKRGTLVTIKIPV